MDAAAAPVAPARAGWARVHAAGVASAAACAVPLVAAVVLAFRAGGYYATAWGTAAIVLLGLLAVAVASTDNGLGGWPGLAALTAFGGLALWQGVSSRWAYEPAAATTATGQTLLYGAGFGLMLVGLRRAWWLPRVTEGVLAVVTATAAGGVGARLLPDVIRGDAETRLSAPVTYWNAMGCLFAFGAVLAVGVAGSAARPLWLRAAAVALVPLHLLGLLMTYSRGGFIVLVVGLALLVVLAAGRIETVALLAVGVAASAPVLAYAREQGLARISGEVPSGPEARRVLLALLAASAAAAAAGLLAAWAVRALPGRARLPLGVALAALALALAGGLLAANWPQGGPVRWADRQFESFREGRLGVRSDRSVADALFVATGSGRWQNWTVAADEWREAPWLGTGAGDYRFFWNEQRTIDLYLVNAHSLYLEVLAENGVVGLALLLVPLLAVLIAVGRALLRLGDASRRRELALAVAGGAVVAVHVGGDWDWQLPAVVLPAVALGAAALKSAGLELGEARSGARVASWLVVPACVAAMALLASPVASAFEVDAAKERAVAGDFTGALERARAAARLQPAAPEPRRLAAYLFTDLGRPALADAAYAEALRRSPRDWSLYADWSGEQLRRGNLPAARYLLSRALALNPREERLAVLGDAIGAASG